MRFAAIETSTEWCSVALSVEGEIAALEERAGVRHGELVLPMLGRLLERAGLASSALQAVVFGAGPGSFTGLRIACSVAQGIAYARGLPVLGVSTLEAIAEESGAQRVLACLDARMHEVYYAALERTPAGAWREAVPALCAAPVRVPRPRGLGWLGCGSGFEAYRGPLLEALGSSLVGVAAEVRPSAVALARLAAPRLEAGEGVEAGLAAPRYLRDKVALTIEEQRARR